MTLETRTHAVCAPDGWTLDVADVGELDAPGPLVIAGHAMMVDRRTLLRSDRPCLVTTLVRHGHRVLVPDLRGHGRSGPTADAGGDWTYDQLVADVGVYLDLARGLVGDRPIVLLGHSLFGHNALAYVGLRPHARVAGVVLLAVDVWIRDHEPSPIHWLAKRGMLGAGSVAVRMVGRMPARRLGIGTADEPPGYWHSLFSPRGTGWRSDDGLDYRAAIRRVRCPVLHVVSQGDRLYARPASARNLTRDLSNREMLSLGETGDFVLDALHPKHMQVVTDPGCEPLWEHVARWIAGIQPATAEIPARP